jgi:putative CocE/NonD family hydrolase
VPTVTKHEVCLEENIATPMRDGTILRSDIFRPNGLGECPVLVSRTPYDKRRTGYRRIAKFMAERGYICVLQDIRGTHASEGEYHLARNGRQHTMDAEDGFDTVEWSAQLPSANGKVCVWGHSYSSWAAWVAAGAQPPSLAGLFGSGMAASILNNTRGIFETGRRLHWMYQQSADLRHRQGSEELTKAEIDRRWYEVERFKWIWFLPFGSIPDDTFGSLTEQLKEYLGSQDREAWDFDSLHPSVKVPTCTVTGWYDRIIGAIEHFEGMTLNGPENLRNKHRLIVGPWGHGMDHLDRCFGPLDFGPDAATNYERLLLDWCDDLFFEQSKTRPKTPVNLFVMGSNSWLGAHSWPPDGARSINFYLESKHGANTVHGDGLLSEVLSEAQGVDKYLYDPVDPVMSLMAKNMQMQPCDQSPLDYRPDVLVYQTAPLSNPLRIIGPVTVQLFISTDVPDTDFTAKLVNVDPGGVAVNVTYGILRCMYRHGYETKAKPLVPGEIYEIQIDLNPTAIEFKRGHKIRLDISSSDFPNFDRNHNTGKNFWLDAELRPANQTVHHGGRYPSQLRLTVVD